MGRLQVDLPADRHTLWDAARREAAGAVLEEQPGKRLVWGGAARNTLELAATGTGCTRARLEHPDGWIEALYWRWWLGRLGRPGWSAGERLAFAAAALTVLAVLTLVPRPARAPFPEVEELVASVTGLGPADDLLLGPGPGVRRFELSAEGQVWHLSLGPRWKAARMIPGGARTAAKTVASGSWTRTSRWRTSS